MITIAKKPIMYVAAIALVCSCLYFLFCSMFGTGNDDGIKERMDRVKSDIRTAENLNQQLADGLSAAQRTSADITSGIARSESSIEEAAAAADRIGRNLEEARKLSDDCERIIRAVEQRNQASTQNP